MKALLTPRLIDFLIEKNYQFFLSQTIHSKQQDVNVGITLKPVKKHPLLLKRHHPFGCYCSILWEPMQTISKLGNAKILVELNAQDVSSYQFYTS